MVAERHDAPPDRHLRRLVPPAPRAPRSWRGSHPEAGPASRRTALLEDLATRPGVTQSTARVFVLSYILIVAIVLLNVIIAVFLQAPPRPAAPRLLPSHTARRFSPSAPATVRDTGVGRRSWSRLRARGTRPSHVTWSRTSARLRPAPLPSRPVTHGSIVKSVKTHTHTHTHIHTYTHTHARARGPHCRGAGQIGGSLTPLLERLAEFPSTHHLAANIEAVFQVLRPSPCSYGVRDAACPLIRGEGRGVSDSYGVRDAACPLTPPAPAAPAAPAWYHLGRRRAR